jgi:hypothetical protein
LVVLEGVRGAENRVSPLPEFLALAPKLRAKLSVYIKNYVRVKQ